MVNLAEFKFDVEGENDAEPGELLNDAEPGELLNDAEPGEFANGV